MAGLSTAGMENNILVPAGSELILADTHAGQGAQPQTGAIASGSLAFGAFAEPITATSGASIPMVGNQNQIIYAGATLAALTLVLPLAPVEGQTTGALFNVAVTALTITGTAQAKPTAAAAGQLLGFVYRGGTWNSIVS